MPKPFVPGLAAFGAIVLGFAPAVAHADRRYYGETYNAATAPPGALDIELWSTLVRPKTGSGDLQYWRHQLELETGITSRWDVALYNVFDRVQGDTLRYQATKLETRYRLSDYGQWFVDPVLYFEARKEWTEDEPWAFEGKLILAKDIGPLNVSANGLYEIELIPAGGQEHELGYAVGVSYEFVPALRVGAETWGNWTRAAESGAWKTEMYAGPAISVAYARTWLVLAAGFGLTEQSQGEQLRAIFALQL